MAMKPKGMMADTAEAPDTGMPPLTVAEGTTEAPAASEETPEMFDMETIMGNFMDLPDNKRMRIQKIILTPMVQDLDAILGTPVFSRLNEQLGTLGTEAEAPAPEETAPEGEAMPEGEGMMAPNAPEEEMM